MMQAEEAVRKSAPKRTYKLRPCSKCGVLFSSAYCRPCSYAARRALRRENPEKAKELRLRYAENRKARARAHYAENGAEIRRKRAVWRAQNKHKVSEKNARYSKENPEKRRIITHNRKAKIKKIGGKLSPGLGARLFKLQRGKCACCGLPLGDKYHLDHIVPVADGGMNVDSNIQLLRSACNMSKGAKDPIDFMQAKGFLV